MENESLDGLLSSWQPVLEEDPHFRQKVLHRIASSDVERGGWKRVEGVFRAARPLALAAVLTLVLLWTVPSGRKEGSIDRQEALYFLLIDPAGHLETASLPVAKGGATGLSEVSLIEMLDWMRVKFSLSPGEFAQVASLHEEYSDRFESLAQRIVHLRYRYTQFEEQRLSDESIDFIALYDLLQERNTMREQANELSNTFVEKLLVILGPAQGNEYLVLLSRAYARAQPLPPESPTDA